MSIEPRRRRVTILGASVACMAAPCTIFARRYPRFVWVWIALMLAVLVYAGIEFAKLKKENPDALVIAHPECEAHVLEMADYIGSTTALLNYSQKSSAKEFIVVTETGILHAMQKASPDKIFIPAPPTNSCACNDCPHMKRNTLEKLYLCMKNGLPEVTVPKDIIERAVKPIERMLEISAKLGL